MKAERHRCALRTSGEVAASARARRPALVQGRGHLRAARQGLLRFQRRRHRRLPRPDASKLDYVQELGRQHDLAAAVLPVAAARRRLRRRRLPQRPPVLRHARRLPGVRARGAPARPARDHRAGRQPHLRPASVVPGRAPRAARARHKRDFYVWSDDPNKYAGTRIIFTDTEKSNWTWDEVAQQYYWHRFFSHQPDLNFDNPRVRKAVFRTMQFWLDMGVDGFRLDAIPYLIERDGTSNENLRETHEVIKEIRARLDEKYREPAAARRSQHVAGGRARVLRRRRRMPHGVPLPADAAHVHGDRAGRPPPGGRDPAADARHSRRTASGRCSCATTTS